MNHHNKWLLYSSTLILVSFLLVVGHISVVECGLGQGPSSSSSLDETLPGKSKVYSSQGNSILTRNSNSEPNNIIRGHPSSDSDKQSGAYVNDGKSNSIANNDLLHNSPHIEYTDTEDDEEDEDSYADETSNEEDIDGTDEDYLESHHEDHLLKPRLGKCCDVGEGLNALGYCTKLIASHIKQNEA